MPVRSGGASIAAAAPASSSATDDPLRGIALSLASTVLFSISDATAKLLTGSLPVIEIGWIRYVVFVGIAAVMMRRARPHAGWPRSPALQVTRGLCLVGSAILFIFGLRWMPLAEASTISFASPMLTALLAVPLLGERVGPRCWLAILAGLAGVVVVMRPGAAGFQLAALLPLASALCWALALVITRRMAATEQAATTVLWSAAVGAATLSLALPFVAAWPSPRDLALAVMLGVVASAGQVLVVAAYRYASASALAPFSYAQLIWAGIAGWLLFAAVPDRWTLAGAAIIAASGVYTAQQERARPRVSASPAAAAFPARRD